MLHHISFNAHDPERVASALAEMIDARVIRAPHPPFPNDAWFVCCGDEAGTLIEVMPWGDVRDPDAPHGAGHDPMMRRVSGAHVLIGTSRTRDAIFDQAQREGWRAEMADAGLFQFIKVWVENAYLVELLTPDLKPMYVASFNAEGVTTLDTKLRRLEQALAG
jgi:hypothetical protein